jgi:hypothetical protein
LSEDSWSQWLDFDSASVGTAPESAGICVLHASMKIMYIGGAGNIRDLLRERLSDSCTSKAKRFRYRITAHYEQEKDQLLKEYAEKHEGKLPLCMENR